MSEDIPLISTTLNDEDKRVLAHLMDIADVLENECPPSIIEWNKAIDREIVERQSRRPIRQRKPKRLPKHVKGVTL